MTDVALLGLFGVCYFAGVLWFGKTVLSGILFLSAKLPEAKGQKKNTT